MQRILVVYNPLATWHELIEKEVLVEARRQKGYLVGKYEVVAASVAANIQRLAKMIGEGDLVVAAGGDGTAALAGNAIIKSGKDATLGVLGYGNFNDFAAERPAKSLTELIKCFERKETTEVYPLEVKIDGVLWRYVFCYVTIGMLAAATQVFDEPKVRKKLLKKQKKPNLLFFSFWTLVKWYAKNHQRSFWPMAGSDYLAINTRRVARVLKGGKFQEDAEKFGSQMVDLKKWRQMIMYMLRGMTIGMKLKETEEDEIKFDNKTEVMIQSEGEAEKVRAEQIVVKKSGKISLKVA